MINLITLLLKNGINFTNGMTGKKLAPAELASAVILIAQLDLFVENAQKLINENQVAGG